jgi:hypothetical protein
MRRTALAQRALRRMSPNAERALLPTSRGKDDERALVPIALICVSEYSEASRPTFFRSAARGLHVPTTLTPEPTKHEPARPAGQRTAASRLLRRVRRARSRISAVTR